MPELPEVETIARDLAPRLAKRRITEIARLDWEPMLETPLATFRAQLPGREIRAVGRRAKWLLFTLDAGWTLALHLRMSGAVTVAEATTEPDRYTHLVLELDGDKRLCFRDVRKFGRVRLLDAAGLAALEAAHGVEPLSDAFTAAWLARALKERRTRLKPLLLDQRMIAGLGNIYVDEALWRAGLHPLRAASSLSRAEIARLHEAIRHVLEQSIARRGSTFRDYRTGTGEVGGNQHHFAVYGREDRPCPRCGRPIVRTVVGQRGTHFCPKCQTA
ncbi:MAG TPA: bifunctional DNA-formamidopyrimidine glycosylase/DNA-(apurinic or apyrimidinic site) lyase [Oscillatoriaceae cyanobacterium]